MAEFILPLAKSIVSNIASIASDTATSYVNDEIKLAMTAKNDLEIIKDKFTAICAILQDAEEKQYTNSAMKVWLKDLKNVAYDIDNLFDEMAYDALLRSVNKGHLWRQTRYYLSTSNPILSRFDLGRKIKSLREQLVHIVSKKNDFNLTERPLEAPRVQTNPLDSCDYVNKAAVLGRDEAKEDVINRLVSLEEATALTVFPIVGMGGIGKTTLAKLVYHDIPNFDIKLWACVSDDFDIEKILGKIMENYFDNNGSNVSLGRLTVKLKELLEGKKYFIVLDDVWVDDVGKWMDLKNVLDIGKSGSVILITTRIPEVANITRTIDPYNLDRLSDSVCWTIFRQLAFMESDDQKFLNLCEIGKSIVQKCHGVPLVVKALGSLLRSERDERKWLEIKNMDNFMKLHGHYDNVLQLLKLSYIKLPSHLKKYFVYLATLEKGVIYYARYEACIQRALGPTKIRYDNSEIPICEEDYFTELLSKSMIQDTQIGPRGEIQVFKLHDMLHDVAMDELGEELTIVTENELKVSESTRCVAWRQLKRTSVLPDDKYLEKLFTARKTIAFRSVGASVKRTFQVSFLEKIISIFSRLRVLELGNSFIYELPSSIGNLEHLRFLDLSGNPMKSLPDTFCELLNLQSLYLLNCEQLEELPKRLHRLINLRFLKLTTLQRSFVGTQFNELPCLAELYLTSCKRLTSLWESDNVGRLASLKVLDIENCPRLTSFPRSMKLLVALERLVIINCQELNMEDGDALSGLPNLRLLVTSEMPQMTRLPDTIQSAAKSLQRLAINDCPYFLRRCAVSVEQDLPFIRHVPQIWLDHTFYSLKPQ